MSKAMYGIAPMTTRPVHLRHEAENTEHGWSVCLFALYLSPSPSIHLFIIKHIIITPSSISS